MARHLVPKDRQGEPLMPSGAAVEKTADPTLVLRWNAKRPRGQRAWDMACGHLERTARELSFVLESELESRHATRARQILEVSSHNPFAGATLIDREAQQGRGSRPRSRLGPSQDRGVFHGKRAVGQGSS